MKYEITGNGDIKHLWVMLDPSDEIFAEKGSMIYYENGIDPGVYFNGKGLKHILGAKLSGEAITILSLKNIDHVPHKLAISASCSMFAIELNNTTLLCRSGAYIASLNKVEIKSKFSIKSLVGGMGAFLQMITGDTTVFLEVKGSPIVIDLTEGESIIADEDHVVALHGIAPGQITAKWSVKNLIAGEGFSMTRIEGPGRVYLSPGSFLNLAETFGNSL